MFGLSFLYPAFLAAALAAAVPILIHLFRRQAEQEVAFSAVRFLHRAPVEHARLRRLREMLLLALRVAALLLLALSFARPYVAATPMGAAGPVTVVAVDTSYSLSAPGQFDEVRRLARGAASSAPGDHAVAVVAFSDRAEVASPPEAGRAAALAAIDQLGPGFGSTRYAAALGQAAEVAGGIGKIVVVTDLQQAGWEGSDVGGVPPGMVVELAEVAPAAANLAVMSVARSSAGIVAVVRNFGAQERSTVAAFGVDGRRIADKPVKAPPGEAVEVRFEARLPPEGLAAVSIEDGEGYQADNTRYFLLDPPAPVALLGVTGGANPSADTFYLERALRLDGEAGAFRLTTASAGALEPFDAAAWRGVSMVLLTGTRGLDRRGRQAIVDYVRGGGSLLAAMGPEMEADVFTEMLGEELGVRFETLADAGSGVSFTPADARHPIFRAFGSAASNLGAVRFARTVGIGDRGTGRRLASFSDGRAAMTEYRLGQGRVLVFGSDLGNRWNDFPLQATFVPFVHETVRYLTASRVAPREMLVADLPAGLPRRPGLAVLPAEPARTADGQASPAARLAVNVDPRESDPASLTATDFVAGVGRLHRTAQVMARDRAEEDEERQRLWQYGLGLMIVGLVAEGLLGRRLG